MQWRSRAATSLQHHGGVRSCWRWLHEWPRAGETTGLDEGELCDAMEEHGSYKFATSWRGEVMLQRREEKLRVGATIARWGCREGGKPRDLCWLSKLQGWGPPLAVHVSHSMVLSSGLAGYSLLRWLATKHKQTKKNIFVVFFLFKKNILALFFKK